MKTIFALCAIIAVAAAVGGFHNMQTTGLQSDEKFMQVLNTAISQMNLGPQWTLKSINSAKQQVVAGAHYIVTVTMTDGTTTKDYELSIISVPWEKTIKLSSFKEISSSSSTPKSTGSWSEITGEQATPSSNSMLDTAIASCLAEDGDLRLGGGYRFSSMVKAEEQVVAGMKYKLHFKAASADGKVKDINCEVSFAPGSTDGKVSQLSAKLEESNANSNSTTLGGGMGGWTTLGGYDANPNMNDDLDEAITECLGANGDMKLGGGYEYSSMVKAETQVVAGIKYKVRFNAANVNNAKETKQIQCTVYFAPGQSEGVVEDVKEVSN